MTDMAFYEGRGARSGRGARILPLACIGLLSLLWPAWGAAQSARTVTEGYEEALKGAQTVATLGPTLFGEQVNLQDGVTSFRHTDLDLKTNSGLTITIGRELGINARDGDMAIYGNELFGNWKLDAPYMLGMFDSRTGWVVNRSNPQQRCSATQSAELAPPYVQGFIQGTAYTAADYWNGNRIHIPGRGTEPILFLPAERSRPADGLSYHGITKSDWRVACLGALQNGTGEGFLVVLPDGTRYRFDWMSSRPAAPIKHLICGEFSCGTETVNLNRVEVFLHATRVEDRFGNWVAYAYDPANPRRLQSITSSDGVSVQLGYLNGRIDSVTTAARVWRYVYTGSGAQAQLSQVIQPDGSSWQFSADNIHTSTKSDSQALWAECWPGLNVGSMTSDQPPLASQTSTVSITHPSGANGTFRFRMLVHGTNNTPGSCWDPNPDYQGDESVSSIPMAFHATSLYSKTVYGPGLPTQEWQYHYAPSWSWSSMCGSGCASTSTTRVSGPDGILTRYVFGNDYKRNAGQMLEVTVEKGGIVHQRTSNTYVANAQGQPFPDRIGHDPYTRNNPLTSELLRPQSASSIIQDGATFSSTVNSFDLFARTLGVTKSSSLGYSKTDTTTYHDNLGQWVIGQVATQATDGIQSARTDYNAQALPWKRYAFGKLQQTLGYRADGTVATVADGRNHTTTLSGWKRGVPQSIQHPDASTQSAAVDDRGWITSVTDQTGARTCYGYDAMGRIASITHSSEATAGVCDTSTWNATTRAFVQANAAEFGIPAGHWRQTLRTGNGYRQTFFDALWRPLLVREFDNGAVTATQRFTRRAYDADGREIFVSYPGRTDALSQGTWTTYDALGRIKSVSQDSEQGLLTSRIDYLSGFRTQTTSPRGTVTTTSFMAWDQPITDLPVAIAHPEGAFTDIVRDAFGKPRSLTRLNGTGSLASTRQYAYDGFQQLCKTIEPEIGSTVFGYDAAGNLAWSAGGFNYPNPSICESTTPYNSGRRIDRTYDSRNRITTLRFPDGRGNQDWTYTPDGKPAVIVTYNAADQGLGVTNAYHYNRRGMLDGQGETIHQHNWYTYGIGYGYDANGHLAAHSYPSGQTVSYAPNALGQPTRAGSYATGISYHPNGAIQQFTYGNGLVHAMTQNARQLPSRVTSGVGVLDLGYGYDGNANVSAITDYVNGRQSRTLGYDGLDRLLTASSAMFGTTGTATVGYAYDALDNLTRVTVPATALAPARDHYYCYDASWLLTNLKTGGCGGASVVGLGYDLQGNLSNKNGQAYDFDYGNRLRGVVGVETYRYDGHGRRVQNLTAGSGSLISQYSAAGQLMYHRNVRSGINTRTDYIYLAGSQVASREYDFATGGTTVKYQHTDALGSPIAVTNTAGQVIERSEYEPYGKVLNRPPNDRPGYTGHVEDAATGLTYMQQRYYDPTIGRFLSVDPVTANSSTGANFNRYWYANNNPYKFIDPDGRDACPGASKSNCVRSDTHAEHRTTGQTTRSSASTDQAMVAGKNTVAVKAGGTQEKVGFVTSNGVEAATDTTTSSKGGVDSATATVPAGAKAVIHGHIDGRSDGVISDKKGIGDAGPLKSGLPNGVVSEGRVGVTEIVGGRLQFRMIDGRMEPRETREMQKNLDRQQNYFMVPGTGTGGP